MRFRFTLRSAALLLALFGVAVSSSIAAQAQSFTITPSSVNFKSVVVGMESNVFEITVTNTGSTSIIITSFSLSPFNTFILEYGWTRTLHPGQYGMWAIRFKPTVAGLVTGQMSFTIEGVSQPQIVTLSGTGTTTGALASVSPNILDFPATSIGAMATQTVTVTNTGTSAFNLTGVTVLPPFGESGYSTTVLIEPNTSFSFQVTFTPAKRWLIRTQFR